MAAVLLITAKKHYFYVKATKHIEIPYLKKKLIKNVKLSAISDHLPICECSKTFIFFSKGCRKLLPKERLLITVDNSNLNKRNKSFSFEFFE